MHNITRLLNSDDWGSMIFYQILIKPQQHSFFIVSAMWNQELLLTSQTIVEIQLWLWLKKEPTKMLLKYWKHQVNNQMSYVWLRKEQIYNRFPSTHLVHISTRHAQLCNNSILGCSCRCTNLRQSSKCNVSGLDSGKPHICLYLFWFLEPSFIG